MKPPATQAALRRLLPARLPVLLTGPPGVGKTALVTGMARELGLDLVISHPVTGDPTDYRGLPWVVDGAASFLPVGDLERLQALENRPAVWLIDDLGQASPAVQASIMQLVHRDGRALNGFRVPESVSVVACTNRAEDRAGVRQFLAPLLSRFATILPLEPDVPSFVHWSIQNGFNPLVPAFLRWKPTYLCDQEPASQLEQRCSPRTWEHVSRILGLGASQAELTDLVRGAISPPVAIEFLAFLQVYHRLPSADLVRADPEGAPVPAELDALYATAVHLAGATSGADFPVLWRYMRRLSPEFQLLYMLSVVAKHPELVHSSTYIAWASDPDNVALLS
ncbi:MAG: ATP-binding protein [Acidobacteriota bacterium]|nr:ATP-binding protein [Acidobacteriota bacterium]